MSPAVFKTAALPIRLILQVYQKEQVQKIVNPSEKARKKDFESNFPGGEGGIRTLEGCNTLPAFQASALDQLCDLSVIIKGSEFTFYFRVSQAFCYQRAFKDSILPSLFDIFSL